MSEALDDLNATGKRKRTRRHAAKVSALKKTKPATRQRETATPKKKTLSGWRGVRVGALMLGLCIIFGVQSAHQSQRMRALFSALQQDQVTRDALLAQRSRLLIERGAMNSYNGTEKLATDELNMRFPETIVRVVKPQTESSPASAAGSRR